jgi:hypothetical protein
MKIFNIIFPVILLLVGLFTSTLYFLSIVLFYLIILFYTNRQVFKRLKSKYFLGFNAILILIYPLFGERKDILFPLNIGFDFNYLEMSARMSLRAILLFSFSNLLLLNISSNKVLSKLKYDNSEMLLDIAMNNYSAVATKTLKQIKEFNFKQLKIQKLIDYIATFMAELLTQDFSKNNLNK